MGAMRAAVKKLSSSVSTRPYVSDSALRCGSNACGGSTSGVREGLRRRGRTVTHNVRSMDG